MGQVCELAFRTKKMRPRRLQYQEHTHPDDCVLDQRTLAADLGKGLFLDITQTSIPCKLQMLHNIEACYNCRTDANSLSLQAHYWVLMNGPQDVWRWPRRRQDRLLFRWYLELYQEIVTWRAGSAIVNHDFALLVPWKIGRLNFRAWDFTSSLQTDKRRNSGSQEKHLTALLWRVLRISHP